MFSIIISTALCLTCKFNWKLFLGKLYTLLFDFQEFVFFACQAVNTNLQNTNATIIITWKIFKSCKRLLLKTSCKHLQDTITKQNADEEKKTVNSCIFLNKTLQKRNYEKCCLWTDEQKLRKTISSFCYEPTCRKSWPVYLSR